MPTPSHGPLSRLASSLVLACAIAVIGCGGGGPAAGGSNPAPINLQAITVTGPNGSVAAGLAEQFTATGQFSDGSTKSLTTVTWSISDMTLGTISPTGLLTTIKQGTVTVTAGSGSVTGNTPFTIGPAVPSGLTISPADSKVEIGSTNPTKLSALLVFTDHSMQDISSKVSWSSTNTFTGMVDSLGNVTAFHTGYTSIGATNGNFSVAAAFAVIAEPRFLYIANYERLVSRATVDAKTGKLRLAGYVHTSTSSTNTPDFACPTTDPSNRFLYVSSAVSPLASTATTGEIDIYAIDQSTGALTPLAGSPFALNDPIGCIQFERTGQFGYASSTVDGTSHLVTFSRNASTGILTLINSISLNSTAVQIAMDPLGQYLFTSTIVFTNPPQSPAQAYGYTIDSSSGALTPVAGTPFPLSNVAGGFSWHPSGNFLYMANAGGQTIDIYSVDRSSGKLTLSSSMTTCINPNIVIFSPDGEFAYTGCSMDAAHDPNSASVQSFAVGSNGALTLIESTPCPDIPSGLSIDPAGRYLYVSTATPFVDSFQIGADGVARLGLRQGIQSNPSFSVAMIGGSSTVQYTPSFAYIAAADDTLSTYVVKTDGTLGSPQSAVVSTQAAPFSLSVVPWGSNLLLASSGTFSANMEDFPLSLVTGAPGMPVSSGYATTAGGVVIDPSEQWAFESDSTGDVIATFARAGAAWNVLTYFPSTGPAFTTFPAGPGAGPMAIDPAGRFLYVANKGAQSISAYQYFGGRPELNVATGSPFTTSASPIALATDFSNPFLYVICADGTLSVYSIDYFSGGPITKVASANLGGLPVGVTAAPGGQFVYAATSAAVSAFSVNAASGALTPVTLSATIQSSILGLYAEPSGKFLYVSEASGVFGYSINADGTLSQVSSAALATPKQPSSMAVSVTIQ